MRRVRRKLWNIKHREPRIWGSLHRPRDFPLLLRVPCRLPCRKLVVKEKTELVLNFILCLREPTLRTLACSRDFMTRPLTGANGTRTRLPKQCWKGGMGFVECSGNRWPERD
jgi:hypothetical protein